MEEYENIKYEKDGVSLDVKVSHDKQALFLSRKEIAILFNRSSDSIGLHIKNIIKEMGKNAPTAEESSVVQLEGGRQVRRKILLYNLDMILAVGNRLKSQNGLILKEWFNAYISTKNNDVIVFDNGNVQLDVRIEPENETVWLTVNQMAILFDTTLRNIYFHIENIYKEGELNNSVLKKSFTTEQAVFKKSLSTETSVTEESSETQKQIIQTASDGKSYLTTLYNLDVILSVGYRVKNKRAIEFRRWVSSILKQYLLKGYAIDKNRSLITNENYLTLYSEVFTLKNKVDNIERIIETLKSEERVIFENQTFSAYFFINTLLKSAREEITIVDGYLDDSFLEFFVGVSRCRKITLITHKISRITDHILERFREEVIITRIRENKAFHDRLIIIDNSVYSLGSSLNNIGKKFTIIRKLDKNNPKDLLRNILKD